MSPCAATRWLGRGLAALVFAAAACSAEREATAPGPTVTAQGFRISESQTGPLGGFGDLKLRIEAPGGIGELWVRERSYEVDLAKSPEASHLPLFGLPRRVWSKTDVTLDFGPYINQKLGSVGEYSFEISVRDRKGPTATAVLVVILESATPEAGDAAGGGASGGESAPRMGESAAGEPTARHPVPPKSAPFRLQRVGAGLVTGADEFGLTWKTIESIAVVIDLRPAPDVEGRLASLEPDAFAAIATGEELAHALQVKRAGSSLRLATANDAAAGRVFAVSSDAGGYVLRADHSATSLSELGTTVTLSGRYKKH